MNIKLEHSSNGTKRLWDNCADVKLKFKIYLYGLSSNLTYNFDRLKK